MKWRSLFRHRAKEPLATRPFDLLCLTVAVVLGVHAPHMPLWLTAALGAQPE